MPVEPPLMPVNHRLEVLDEVGSTNAEAMRRARAGETGPLWIMARRQSAGRGRSGRKWVSEPGNLYASLLLSLASSPSRAHHLALLTGVAVYDAVDCLAAASGGSPGGLQGLRLKWPNDVLIGQRKCAGILAETMAGGASTGASWLHVILGIGVNLAHAPMNVAIPVTYLAAHGINADPERMLASVAASMDRWLGHWREGAGFAQIREAWMERAGPIGEPISINTGTGRLSGRFNGIDNDGALLMLDEIGTQQRYTYGDVALPGAGQQE